MRFSGPIFGRRVPAAGLDLGQRQLKLVQLKKAETKGAVRALATIPTPAGAMEDGRVKDVDGLAKALAELVQRARPLSPRVVAAVPSRQLVVRQITLPVMPPEELEAAVAFEAGRQLPLDSQQLVVDYLVLGEVREEGAAKLSVLLLAAPRVLSESYAQVLAAAGLKLVALEPEPLALWRAATLNRSQPEGTLAVVDLGDGGTGITIFEDGKIRLCRWADAGGRGAASSVAAAFEVGLEAAVKLQEQDGETIFGALDLARPDPATALQLEMALRAGLTDIFAEVRQSIEFYEMQFAGARVSRVWLTGGLARLTGIDSLVSEELGIEAEIVVSPLEGLDDPALTCACGLALREVLG